MIDNDLATRLDEAWQPARRAGVLGSATVGSLHQHACGFIPESWRGQQSGNFVDCGAGAGVLGIFLALEMPWSSWALVDSSERRCELAQSAVTAVGLTDRVTVVHGVLDSLARRPQWRARQDGAVARLFGPAAELAECALPLLRTGATLVVSVSRATRAQWEDLDLASTTGCEVTGAWSSEHGRYLAVSRTSPGPAQLPRRRAARLRMPLDRMIVR